MNDFVPLTTFGSHIYHRLSTTSKPSRSSKSSSKIFTKTTQTDIVPNFLQLNRGASHTNAINKIEQTPLPIFTLTQVVSTLTPLHPYHVCIVPFCACDPRTNLRTAHGNSMLHRPHRHTKLRTSSPQRCDQYDAAVALSAPLEIEPWELGPEPLRYVLSICYCLNTSVWEADAHTLNLERGIGALPAGINLRFRAKGPNPLCLIKPVLPQSGLLPLHIIECGFWEFLRESD